jgi:ABC-type transport system involved in cytochrome bd biosynthesis fused ATPase/permease subunit
MTPIRAMLRAIDSRGRTLATAYGVIHLADRLALLAVAVAAPGDDRRTVVATALAFGALTLVRAFVGSVAMGHVQAQLHVRIAESLLLRDLFRASPLEDADPEAALLDGIDVGARVGAALVPAVIGDAVAVPLVAVVLAHVLEPSLLAVGGVAVLAAAAVLLISRRITMTEAERAWDAQRPVTDRLVAILAGRLEIVGNGADGAMRAGVRAAAESWRLSVARFERASAVTGRLPLLLAALLVALVLVGRGTLPGKELALHAIVLAAALPPFAGVARGLHELTKCEVRVAPLARLLVEPKPEASSNAIAAPRRVALEGATFRYAPALPDVLRAASCDFAVGTVTVLAGPNGSGKSTLLRLLLAIEPPREGRLVVDGAPLAGDGANLRAHIAYLPQRPFLSDRATVRDAFRLLATDLDDSAALTWLDRVGLVEKLRAKASADPLSVRIGQLSTGQRQRLALARIGVLDRPIWLLDEPDASLDADGIARLESLIEEERSRRLIVVAAHASGLRRVADRVITIEEAKISDETRPSGTFR